MDAEEQVWGAVPHLGTQARLYIFISKHYHKRNHKSQVSLFLEEISLLAKLREALKKQN